MQACSELFFSGVVRGNVICDSVWIHKLYMMTESKIKETTYSITSRIQRNRIRCRCIYTIEKPYKCSILYCIVQLICICAVVYGIYTMAIKSAGKNNV